MKEKSNLNTAEVQSWFDFQVSQYAIVQMIFLGLLLFLFLRISNRFLNKKVKYQDFLERTWAVGEAIIWVLFFMASAKQIILNPKHYTLVIVGLVLVLLIWFAWFALRDLVAGIMLKLEGGLKLQEKVIVNNTAGNIKKLSYFSLLLETDTGQKVSLPYHLIKNKEKIKDTISNFTHKTSLKLKINKENTATQIEEKLQKYIFNAPWTVPSQNSIIFLETENAQYYHFNIIVFLLNKKYMLRFKEYMTTNMDNLIFE